MGEALIVHAIEEAKETISIFTPYFCPTERAMAALTFAALRGVKITIILPHIPDKYSALVLSRAFAHKLTSYGVGVYELTAGFMHAKNILIDDTLFLGSYNFDCRSFHANQECGLCFFGGNAVRQAREDFANTLPLCLPLAPHPSFRDKLLYTLLAPFAPLL
jgi:cardiolipin synthase